MGEIFRAKGLEPAIRSKVGTAIAPTVLQNQDISPDSPVVKV